MSKDPKLKEGTLEVPGLSSLLDSIDKAADERHQSNHAGVPPLKEHRELPSEEKRIRALKAQAIRQATKALMQLIGALKAQAIRQAIKALMQSTRALEAQALKKALEA